MRTSNRLKGYLFLAVGLVTITLLLCTPLFAQSGAAWYVSPGGSGNRSGSSFDNAFATIQAGLVAAQPGDTIYLASGTYVENVKSVRGGTQNGPISIIGKGETSILTGEGSGRVFEINHDYLILDDFRIEGNQGRNGGKLIFVLGTQTRRGPTGLIIRNMTVGGAGGECIRLRYFVTNAQIYNNRIGPCGYDDFFGGGAGVNGEGVYIGTADNQWGDGKNPTSDPDISRDNHVHHNTFNMQGNECVEAKEGATANMVEYNTCTGQLDPNAGGIGFRGGGNTARYNTIYGNVGAGVRVGGDAGYGAGNHIYGNTIYSNKAGGIKFQANDQGTVCGNIFFGPGGATQPNPSTGSFGDAYRNKVAAPCAAPGTPPTVAPTATPVATIAPPTVGPTDTPLATVAPPTTTPIPTTPTEPTATSAPTVAATPMVTDTPSVTPPAVPVYVSFSHSGQVDGIAYTDDDILRFDPQTNEWSLWVDGSELGIKRDWDALHVNPDGSILLSVQYEQMLPGLSDLVRNNDIVRLDPSTGAFSLYLSGEALGLDAAAQNVDGLFVGSAPLIEFQTLEAASASPVAEPAEPDVEEICFLPPLHIHTTYLPIIKN